MMRVVAAAAAFVLILVSAAEGRVRAVRHPAALPAPRSVMWIAAHPDDEVVVAPLLAKWCLDETARCAMLILTRGEAGTCALAGGCFPDLASVRSGEAAAAAELFHAELFLLRERDGMLSAAPPELVSTVASYIETFRPDLILTFDPRHGTTCHHDHRAAGAVAVAAAGQLSFAPALYLVQTRVEISSSPVRLAFSSAVPGAQRFDATRVLPVIGFDGWSFLMQTMERHPSQFPTEWLAAAASVPESQRAVHLALASAILRQPVKGCP